MRESTSKLSFDPGSFKDPEGRVFYHDGRVFRTLSADARARIVRVGSDGTLTELIDRGLMIDAGLVDTESLGLDRSILGETVLRQRRLPMISYPHEWSFEMLRDGALVTLDLLEACLAKDLILKDATAFNVTADSGRMVFFDVLSIDDYTDSHPWDGYAQFCREFLFPLMLTSYKGVEFQPWFRGTLQGLPVRQFARLMSLRDRLRPGVLKHAVLQAGLERSFSESDVEVRSSFKSVKFAKGMILANISGLRKLIRGLPYEVGDSVWGAYAATHSYNTADYAQKRDFVAGAIGRLAPSTVVDLGGNIGDYSLLVAPQVERVVCVDIDPACINTLYKRVRADAIANVVPIVGDLLNPSPWLGWALNERRDLFSRIRSDAFLALALVHHICIGGNVPIDSFAKQLADIAPEGVVEWVDKDDAMVQRLLRNRSDVFADYSWDSFRAALEAHFTIAETRDSHEGRRRLCLLRAR